MGVAEDRKRTAMGLVSSSSGPRPLLAFHCHFTTLQPPATFYVHFSCLGRKGEPCSGPLPPPCVHTGDGRGEGMLGKCPLVDAPGIPAESQPSLFPSFPGRDADRRKKTG